MPRGYAGVAGLHRKVQGSKSLREQGSWLFVQTGGGALREFGKWMRAALWEGVGAGVQGRGLGCRRGF